MAFYTLSVHSKCGLNVLFDRVCSFETSPKLKEIFTKNVEEGYVLKETKVAANKMGPWSDISGEEPVSAIAVLINTRYNKNHKCWCVCEAFF